jgi:hypothetical protein
LEPRTDGAASSCSKHKGMRPRSNAAASKPCTIDVSDSDMGQRQHEGDHQMATTTRPPTKTITMPSASEEPIPEPVTQRKRAEGGRFRLQVDRQTKASYATYEAAEKAGMGIKKEHPILQVAVYDGVESVNKIIELP